MITATKKYSSEAKDLLSGQIKNTRYSGDIRRILSLSGISLTPGYIRFVVHEKKDQDQIWDAVKQIVSERKHSAAGQAQQTEEIKKLVALN